MQHRPVKRNEHSSGSALTTTLLLACSPARLGLAAHVSMLNAGKYVSTLNKQPAMMIIFRPLLSDRAQNTVKSGVPITSEIAIKMFALALSSLSAPVIKSSAHNCPVYQITP